MTNILDYVPENPGPKYNLSGMVTHTCICGCDLWRAVVKFDDYEIGMYFLDIECLECGTRATAPTLDERPEEL